MPQAVDKEKLAQLLGDLVTNSINQKSRTEVLLGSLVVDGLALFTAWLGIHESVGSLISGGLAIGLISSFVTLFSGAAWVASEVQRYKITGEIKVIPTLKHGDFAPTS